MKTAVVSSMLFFLLSLCGSIPSFSQCPEGSVWLSTQAEVNAFVATYPNCTTISGDLFIGDTQRFTDIGDLSGLSPLETVEGRFTVTNNIPLTDLSVIANLQTIGLSINVTGNQNLINLLAFKNIQVLSRLSIVRNPLLPNLAGLENITTIKADLSISENLALENLHALEKLEIVDGEIVIQENLLLKNLIGLENLTKIQAIKIHRNRDLESLYGLKVAGPAFAIQITANPVLKSITGLQNITETFDFIIANNPSLKNLAGFENIDLAPIFNGTIFRNESLSLCSELNICRYLEQEGSISISENAGDCTNDAFVLAACNNRFAKIKHTIFYDSNRNALQDEGELVHPDATINIAPKGLKALSTAQNDGAIFLENGEYTISYGQSSLPNWALTTNITNYQITLNQPEQSELVTFGIAPIKDTSIITTLINSPDTKCDQSIVFDITTKNEGTTIVNGTLWFFFGSNILNPQFIDFPDTIEANRVGWHFENLFPGHTFSKQLQLTIPGPAVFPIGNPLQFESFATYDDKNRKQVSTPFIYRPIVRCMEETNDKLVSPNRANKLTLLEEDLIYTIRFQNLGNDEVYDLIIQDTLDRNLDINTFKIVSSSHFKKLNTTISKNRVLRLNFENIYLPDSTTDFEASQGYVSYSIQANKNLAEETIIKNTASIYFDSNPPIITNTTENSMVSGFFLDEDEDGFKSNIDCDDRNPVRFPTAKEIPNNGIDEDCDGSDLITTAINEIAGSKIAVFPNPVQQQLTIQQEGVQFLKASIYEVTGRLIISKKLASTSEIIDLSAQHAGLYILEIEVIQTGQRFIEKIIIE